MKKLIFLTLLLLSGFSQAQVTTTIHGQISPGVYGQITLGDVPPMVVYREPRIVYEQQYRSADQSPMYLYVPQNEQQYWNLYCSKYSACGRPVYFVQEKWYRENYIDRPARHGQQHWNNGHHYGHYRYDREFRNYDERRNFEQRRDERRGFEERNLGNGYGNQD
jgi:hypothetical protein